MVCTKFTQYTCFLLAFTEKAAEDSFKCAEVGRNRRNLGQSGRSVSLLRSGCHFPASYFPTFLRSIPAAEFLVNEDGIDKYGGTLESF
jgi:hypothetical protein